MHLRLLTLTLLKLKLYVIYSLNRSWLS